MPVDESPTSPDDPVADDVAGIAALGDPTRRALYRFVAAQGTPVNREQAAAALGVPRHVAKFHLDKLVADGLLDVEFARPPGRTGPGAGRPAKLFRRSAREWSVTLPARHYDLAGRLLAQAVIASQRDEVTATVALGQAARKWGASLGRDVTTLAGGSADRDAVVAATMTVLAEGGYEPRLGDDGVTLANCPFHRLAQEYTDLVCGMNLELVEGMLAGLDHSCGLTAVLDPSPGRCCVRITTSG